ncbi:MAG: hypothetical protein K5770_17050 [Lachnospiraceae bacterium]|nr:hypothetical protein [Lachnospiraceae bacterium]
MADNDRIYTGSIVRNEFLYRSWKDFSHVIRIMARVKEPVSGETLYYAVQESVKRYPYFCRKVIRRGGEYEITLNEAPVPVYEGTAGICLGSREACGHYLAVCYDGCNIYFDIYHSMADAQGAIPWAKTVLYLYLNKKYALSLPKDNIRLPGEGFLRGETEDPYEKLCIRRDMAPVYEPAPIKNFEPDDRFAQSSERVRYHIRVSEPDIIKLAKTKDGSPTVVSAYFLKETVKKLFPERGGLPIVCNVSHSLRDICQGPENYHDQVSVLSLRYNDKTDAFPMDKQFSVGRGQLIIQSDEANMLYDIRKKAEFAEKLDALKTVDEKRMLYQNSMEQVVSYPETCTVSYPGKIRWGAIEEYLDEIFASCRALISPIMTSLIPLNGWFYYCFVQKHDTPLYSGIFVRLLREAGVRAEVIRREKEELSTVYLP